MQNKSTYDVLIQFIEIFKGSDKRSLISYSNNKNKILISYVEGPDRFYIGLRGPEIIKYEFDLEFSSDFSRVYFKDRSCDINQLKDSFSTEEDETYLRLLSDKDDDLYFFSKMESFNIILRGEKLNILKLYLDLINSNDRMMVI